ncbi:MAG: ATP-binding protein [Verrucomicrobiales bacterium]
MEIKTDDYEKLGAFYLGREYDPGASALRDSLVLYDSKDLVTHGVVLGMTGSGKTGLCLSLLEEAAIDNIPAIIIDPKGDLPNLLLTFPELRPGDFRPWINEDDAARKGQTADAYAAAQADLWRRGLAEWGQSGARISAFRERTDMVVYTPGSNAGIPVSILSSLDAPPFEVVDDGELFGDRIESTVSSLLALIGVSADPLQSREHILLSTIFGTHWRKGEDLTLARLVQEIQTPPFGQVGVVDLESFMPEKKRVELAMGMNSLLAAPGFQAWLSGVSLDISKLLYTPEGKARLAIFSIAHLGDAERMFFVSLLLNQMVGWMRLQSGTTSLRALLYMDEVFGYLPPTANPPSKKPMLTLLKQGRAFGVGVLLATQNPVDLDYKALSNMGTWWLGRLQTERDKARVLDGLEGAAAAQQHGFNRAEMDRLLSGLGNRVFLMNNAHEDHPVVMQVRWCLSYLRGPLTRTQIKSLMDPRREALVPAAASPAMANGVTGRPVSVAAAAAPASQGGVPVTGTAASPHARPAVAKAIREYFLPVVGPHAAGHPVVGVPHVVRAAEIGFVDAKKGLNWKHKVIVLDPLSAGQTAFDLPGTIILEGSGVEAWAAAPDPATTAWRPVPAFAMQAAAYKPLKSEFADWCYTNQGLPLMFAEELNTWSRPGESEGAFRARLGQAARETRDRAVEELRAKYARKAAPLEERLRRAEAAVEKEKDQQKGAWIQTAATIGGSVLGALLGRKGAGLVRRSSTTATVRQASSAWKQQGDVGRAQDTVAAIHQQLDALDTECAAEMQALQATLDPASLPLRRETISPLKKNIVVTAIGLAWLPYFQVSESALEPAWEANR